MKRNEILFVVGMLFLLIAPGLVEMLPEPLIEKAASVSLVVYFIAFIAAIAGLVYQTLSRKGKSP